MGITRTMQQQVDPDGRAGHKERELIYKQLLRSPKKKKFTGKQKIEAEQSLSGSVQTDWDIGLMKRDCHLYKTGCQLKHCLKCRKKEKSRHQFKVLETDFREPGDYDNKI